MTSTSSSTTSTRALYLSNWQNLIGIWMAGKLAQTDQTTKGPRLGELHYLGGAVSNRSFNQIVDYTGFFRDESASINYTNVGNFDSEGWFESDVANAGVLTTNYLTYHGATIQPRLNLSRSYVCVPNQPFLVICYTLQNPTGTSITFNVLDQLHPARGDSSSQMHGWYDATRNALFADMSAIGQFFIVLGALQPVDSFQVGDESVSSSASSTVSAWYSFDATGTLQNNAELRASDIDLAFQTRVTLGAGETKQIYFYLTVQATLSEAQAAADTARASSGASWFEATASSYNAWLTNGNRGKRVQFDDVSLNLMFDRALIVIKNLQNPEVGTFSAATSPFAYGYKNWMRDAAITSIALDASGHPEEAANYWQWMADRQGSDGAWKTTYSMWDSNYLPFVEPEYDSIGVFIYGVYRHYLLTGDVGFLGDVWPNVKKAAAAVMQNLQSNGFGAADSSIWEEQKEFNVFTQTWYVIGLYAAQCLAEIQGDTTLTDTYAAVPASILTALQRPSNWNPPGMWNPLGYYNRSVNLDNSPRTLIDSSSNILMALGVIDAESARSQSHVGAVIAALSHDVYGLARYKGDDYYAGSPYDPAGNEALAVEPIWPQMSMWVTIFEILQGQRAAALSRLQWCASVFAKGFMPTGEAVSNVSLQPVLSSMSEPLTAASFILAALCYEGKYDLPIAPPIYDAGTFKAITVGSATSGDWSQWTNVPYFVAAPSSTVSSTMCAIKRVYITNDAVNLYLRVDNVAGFFSDYQHQPLFALRVYSQDFSTASAPSSQLGIDNQPLGRLMSYLVERHSDAPDFLNSTFSGTTWNSNPTIESVIVPQWDPNAGRLEAVIPISSFAISNFTLGMSTALVAVQLCSFDSLSQTWKKNSKLLLRYRLSTSDQPWIYGNIEL